MELRLIWEIILRRRWIIIQAFLTIFLVAIISTILLLPVYETSAKISIKTSDTESSLLTSIGLQGLGPFVRRGEPEIETRVSLSTAAPVLEKVISRLQLRDRNGELLKPSDLLKSKFILSKIFPEPYVEAKPVEDTNLIIINARSTDPEEAAMIANAVAEVYIEENLEQKKEDYRSAKEFIEDQIKMVKDNYLSLIDEIKRFKIEEKTVDLEQESKLAIERMEGLLKEKEETIINLSKVKAKIETLNAQRSREDEIFASSIAIGENPQIKSLKETLFDLEMKIAGLLTEEKKEHPDLKESEVVVSNYAISEIPQIEIIKKTLSSLKLELTGVLSEKMPDHPDAIALKRKIADLKTQLNNEIKDFRRVLTKKIAKVKADLSKEIENFKASSKDLQLLERELAALGAHLKIIDEEIDSYISQLSSIPGKALIEAQLELRYKVNQELYSSLLEYLYQVGIAEAMTLSDIRLVEPAVIPEIDKPKSPNKKLNAIIGIFLGLFFGLFLGFLMEYLDNTIKTSDDAKELELTVLGTVPKVKRKESPLLIKKKSKEPIFEAYRTVRNSIKFISPDKPINTILITSPIENEGKTTNVINLGILFAHEGKKVLVIDADLYRPGIHKIFGLSNSIGLTTILTDFGKTDEAIYKLDIEGLNVLTSGPIPPDPGRMVESKKMRDLIEQLNRQYDLVIIDSPPIFASNDAIVLGGYTDISVLIAESKKTTQKALFQAKELLSQANIQLIGCVINKFDIGKSGYYYNYYYKEGYYGEKKK